MGGLAFQLSWEPSAKGLAIAGSAGWAASCAVVCRKDGNEGGSAKQHSPARSHPLERREEGRPARRRLAEGRGRAWGCRTEWNRTIRLLIPGVDFFFFKEGGALLSDLSHIFV